MSHIRFSLTIWEPTDEITVLRIPQQPCYQPCLKTVDRSIRNKVFSDLDVLVSERFWQGFKRLANPLTCICEQNKQEMLAHRQLPQFRSSRGLSKHTCVILDKSFLGKYNN